MQMGHDFDDGRFGAAFDPGIPRVPGAFGPWEEFAESSAPVHPDWSDLRARFAAIHALHRSLEVERAGHVPAGSFFDSARAVLRSSRATTRTGVGDVNLTCSAKVKQAGTIMTAVAVSPTPGDRGLQ